MSEWEARARDALWTMKRMGRAVRARAEAVVNGPTGEAARRLAEGARGVADGVARRAWEAAQESTVLRAGIDQARVAYAEARREAEARFAEFESELWKRINRLQSEAGRMQRQATRAERAAEFYQVLRVPNGADLDTVKAAFRARMREVHPDRHAHDPEAEARAHAEAQAINIAYQELVALLTGREDRRSS